VAWVRLGGAGALRQGGDPHPTHQRGHVRAPDGHPPKPQQIPEHPAAGTGMLEMPCIEVAHQRHIRRRDRLGDVVHRRPGNRHEATLAHHRQRVLAVKT